jgi:hypothetical protein
LLGLIAVNSCYGGERDQTTAVMISRSATARETA